MSEEQGTYAKAAAHTSRLWGHHIPERPDWHALARCGRNGVLGDDAAARVRMMFPKRGEDSSVARSVCSGCPVTEQCREANQGVELRHARDVGVWFGTSGRMRRDMKPPLGSCACGERFERTSPGQVYCCDDCRAEAHRKSQLRYRGVM